MNVFRNLKLQRTLGLFLLFAALFSQINTLYACDSMGGKPQHACCCGEHDSTICPMADSCAMHEQRAETSCCEVSYDILNDTGMINSSSTVDCLTLLLDGPQPPPVFIDEQSIPASSPIIQHFTLTNDQRLLFSHDQQIYLFTRRLRL